MNRKKSGDMEKAFANAVDRLENVALQWQHELPEIDSVVFQTVSLITLIGLQIENEFRSFSQAELDMSPGDLRILLALRRSSPTYSKSPVQLEKSLLVTSGAITKQIARLEVRKLVERLPHKDGRRGYQIRLTRSGTNLLDRALGEHQLLAYPIFARAFHALPEAEQRGGLRFLRRLMGKLGTSHMAQPASSAGRSDDEDHEASMEA